MHNCIYIYASFSIEFFTDYLEMWIWLLGPLLLSPSFAVSQLTGLGSPSVSITLCLWIFLFVFVSIFDFSFTLTLSESESLNCQVWTVQQFPLLFVFSSLNVWLQKWQHTTTMRVKEGRWESLFHGCKMPSNWKKGGPAILIIWTSDHLYSRRMMKNYASKQIGKVKRSRMWAPPLRSVSISKLWHIFIHFLL